MIKFNKYNVTDSDSKLKARIFYSAGKLINDDRNCVTLYAKDYGNDLGKIFSGDYENNSDSQTDYFEQGHVRIFEDSPLYAAALARASN